MEQRIIEAEKREKSLVREFFDNKKKGFFVDVGANQPDVLLSQSYHLEKELGWSGILIEPIDYLYQLNLEKRANSKSYRVACTSPEKTGKMTLHIPVVNGADVHVHAGLEMKIDHGEQRAVRKQEVDAVTLNSILENENIKEIDLLSIDVEGTELDVLKGMDFGRYKPKLILLEDKMVYLNKHIYLRRHGYHLVRRTSLNNWYVPKEDVRVLMNKKERFYLFRRMFLSIWIRKIIKSIKMRKLRPLLHL